MAEIEKTFYVIMDELYLEHEAASAYAFIEDFASIICSAYCSDIYVGGKVNVHVGRTLAYNLSFEIANEGISVPLTFLASNSKEFIYYACRQFADAIRILNNDKAYSNK